MPTDDPRWAELSASELEWRQLSLQAVRRLLRHAGVARIVTAGRSLPIDLGRLNATAAQLVRLALAHTGSGRSGHGGAPPRRRRDRVAIR